MPGVEFVAGCLPENRIIINDGARIGAVGVKILGRDQQRLVVDMGINLAAATFGRQALLVRIPGNEACFADYGFAVNMLWVGDLLNVILDGMQWRDECRDGHQNQ